MSRFAAGLGGGLGAIGGAVAGSYAGKMLHGRMTVGDAEQAGIALGAILGATFGAALGAGPEQVKVVGVGAPPSLGVSGIQAEWRLL